MKNKGVLWTHEEEGWEVNKYARKKSKQIVQLDSIPPSVPKHTYNMKICKHANTRQCSQKKSKIAKLITGRYGKQKMPKGLCPLFLRKSLATEHA